MLKLLNPLKRDRFTGWAQLEEGVSVCRTRCTGSFLAGRSINRNGAPPFNPDQAPESAIKKAKVTRVTQATVRQSGESLKLSENPSDRLYALSQWKP